MRATGSADQVLDEAEKAIFHVAEERLRAGFLSMRTVGERSIKMIEDLTHRRETITGIATGFLHLDEWTAGLQPSDLVILAARPSMGKTTLALNIAAHAALRHGRTVGVFSLEMSHQQLFSRMLCAEARVDATPAADRTHQQGRMGPDHQGVRRTVRVPDVHRRHAGGDHHRDAREDAAAQARARAATS